MLHSEQIPNHPLNGEEVRQIAVRLFDQMLARDCMFLRQTTYRRVALSITASFHLGGPMAGGTPHTVEVHVPREGALEGKPPLEAQEGEPQAFVALEREVELDNPNLERVHHGLPIRVAERNPPEPLPITSPVPGEPPPGVLSPFPTVTVHEIRYDPSQFAAPPEPVDRDVTAREAQRLGVSLPAPPQVAPPPNRTPQRGEGGRFLKKS